MKTLAIIEDSAFVQEFYKQSLGEKYNLHIHTKQSEFCRYILDAKENNQLPDLIISDKQLDYDNHNGCHYLMLYSKEQEWFKNIKKIMITSNYINKNKQCRDCETGRKDYINNCYSKNATPSKIEEIIENELDN